MDIIETFQRSLGISETSARGLAGQVFGLIEDTVRERVSFGVASQIHTAIPELLKWQASSPTIVPGSLHVSDLTAERTENDEAELIRLLERFGIEVSKSSLVGALALQFLATRVDPKVLTIVAFTMPALTHNK